MWIFCDRWGKKPTVSCVNFQFSCSHWPYWGCWASVIHLVCFSPCRHTYMFGTPLLSRLPQVSSAIADKNGASTAQCCETRKKPTNPRAKPPYFASNNDVDSWRHWYGNFFFGWLHLKKLKHAVHAMFSNQIKVWRVALSCPDGPANFSAAPLLHFSLSQGSCGVLRGTLRQSKMFFWKVPTHRLHRKIIKIHDAWTISTCFPSWRHMTWDQEMLTPLLTSLG